MNEFFLWWALIAVAITYSGIITSNYSNKTIWKKLSRVGQIIGAVGLFAILLYLAIK